MNLYQIVEKIKREAAESKNGYREVQYINLAYNPPKNEYEIWVVFETDGPGQQITQKIALPLSPPSKGGPEESPDIERVLDQVTDEITNKISEWVDEYLRERREQRKGK